jgi:DNA helicase INO80
MAYAAQLLLTFWARPSLSDRLWSLVPSNVSQWATNKHLHALSAAAAVSFADSCLSRPDIQIYAPAAVAPPVLLYCPDRSFVESQAHLFDAPMESLALYGMPRYRVDSEPDFTKYHGLLPAVPPAGIFGASPPNQLPPSRMQVPEAKSLIYDSAKLARLDMLLQLLKTGDHRVLIYSQMTRMLDLMEEYLIYRRYKYLRLDGSSKLEDRRDMVIEWQTRYCSLIIFSVLALTFAAGPTSLSSCSVLVQEVSVST